MAIADLCPLATAAIAEPGPVTTSPAIKTPPTLLMWVFGSHTIRPRSSVLILLPLTNDILVIWPMVMIMVSASISFILLLSNEGLNLPLESNTDRTFTTSSPFTLSPSLCTAFGPHRLEMVMPSSTASSTSHFHAGISSALSRQTISTFFTPSLFAARATSIATLPPPMTSTLSPKSTFFSKATSVRKGIASKTPSPSTPGIFRERLSERPTATSTES